MLLGSGSLDELLDRITDELKRLVPYDVLTVYRVDPVRSLLVPLHSVDLYAAEILDSPLPLGKGLTGWVVEQRLAQNVPAAHLDPRIELVPGTESEPETIAAVPLMVRDQPIGVLNVYRLGEGVTFSDDEFELICHFADLAALALDNTQIREQLTREAQTDWLTGLFNHRVYQERVRAELERAHRYKRPMALVTFDLDDFKLLNDVHGHMEGDLMLRRVASAAGSVLRASDSAFRVGGEEFAILMPETGKRAAKAAADRLCARVRQLPGPRSLTVSCGVAAFPDDAKNPTELLAAADAALYVAKERGKDRAASYSSAVRAQRDTRRRRRTPAGARVPDADQAAGRAGNQAEPAERRLADRRDDCGRAAHDDRLPQRPGLPARRRPADAGASRLRRQPVGVRRRDVRRVALRRGGGHHGHRGRARADPQHRRRAAL